MANRICNQACSFYEKISKRTIKSMFEVGTKTRTWLDSIEDNDWTVTSFDPSIRVVCFDVLSKSNTHHMSLTLPDMSNRSWY